MLCFIETSLCTCFPVYPSEPTILQTDHNFHDDVNLPLLLPTELTLPNELVHDVVHHSNSDEDMQNSSLKPTHVNKIALPDKEDHSISQREKRC